MNKSFNKIIKQNVVLLVLSLVAVTILASSISYALFQTENKNEENQVISIGTLDADITSIDGAVEIRDIYPIEDSELEDENKYGFTILNNGDYDLNYVVYLTDNTINVKDNYEGYNPLDKSLFKYMNYSLDGSVKSNLESILDNDKMILFSGILKKGESEDHFIQFWLDTTSPNDIVGTVLSLDIHFDGVVGDNPSKDTLNRLKLKVNNDTPDFSKSSLDDNTNGLYSIEDDYGISYYYRGNVDNNYIKFGKNKDGNDMYWRIVRINGNGSLRLVYDGTRPWKNGTSDETRVLVKDFEITDEETTYTYIKEDTLTSSSIKDTLDNWYKENIIDTGYSRYISNEIFCNESSRRVEEHTPSLKCSKENSYLLKYDFKGNGLLDYPIGLLSSDEVMLAGETSTIQSVRNTVYYLYKGEENSFYTMTPSDNNIYNSFLDGTRNSSIVPVINLSYNSVKRLQGNGTVTFDELGNVIEDNAYYLNEE